MKLKDKTVLPIYALVLSLLSLATTRAEEQASSSFLPLDKLVVTQDENPPRSRALTARLDDLREGRRFLTHNEVQAPYDVRPYERFIAEVEGHWDRAHRAFPFDMTMALSGWPRHFYPHDTITPDEWRLRVKMANGMLDLLHQKGTLVFYNCKFHEVHQKKLAPDEQLPVESEYLVLHDGTPNRDYPCLNNPRVRQRVRVAMDAVFTSMDLDGIYIDEPFVRSSTFCYCAVCRGAFRGYLLEKYGRAEAVQRHFGKALSAIEPVPPSRRLEERRAWYDWFRFVQKTRIDYLAFMYRCAQEAAEKRWGKRLLSAVSGFYSGGSDLRQVRLTELMARPEFSGLWSASYWQCFGDHYDDIRISGTDFRSFYHQYVCWNRAQSRRKPVWMWEIAKDEPGWVFEVQVYSSLAGGISGIIPFVPRPEAHDGIRRAFRFCRTYNDYLTQTQPASPVAIYLSQDYPSRNRDIWTSLINRHIPAEYVPGDIPQELRRYRVVIISGPGNMTEDEAEALGRWVADGGALIAFGPASSKHACGEDRPAPLLAEVLGIDGPFRPVANDRPRVDEPAGILRSFRKGDVMPYGQTVTTGWQRKVTRTVRDGWTSTTRSDATVLAVWSEERQPAIAVHRYGKGKCVLVGGSPAALTEAHRESLLYDLVKWGLDRAMPIEIEGLPRACDVNVLKQRDRLMVHLLNLEPVTAKVRKARPLKEVRVSVEIPPGLKIEHAQAISPDHPPRPVPFKEEAGRIRFSLPELEFYEIIAFASKHKQ